MADQRQGGSIVQTGSAAMARLHETRVAISADAGEDELNYIRGDERITDVVVASKKDAVDTLHGISRIAAALQEIGHVNAVRLRSLRFAYDPEAFTPALVDRLAAMNRLSLVNPLRLEIETQFLHPEEIRPAHALAARRLANRGITVYCNTPLLGRVNDTADEIHELAYQCRRIGIEFHHLYAAGLPVQEAWNAENPVSLYDVVDIATRVRRDGSGREIPRYIILTALGEVDFGLTSAMGGTQEDLTVTLVPYDLDYYRGMDKDFVWPEGVSVDADGHPVLPVTGLRKTTDFALS